MALRRKHHPGDSRARARPALILFLALTLCPPTPAVEFAGGTGDPNDPYQIATADQLIAISSDPSLYDKHFVLVADIDLDPNLPGGRAFNGALIAPNPGYSLPAEDATFTGTFNGNGHVIRNLIVNLPAGSYRAGLFGLIGRGGRVENLHLEAADVRGDRSTGALAGENWGAITQCSATGLVRGREEIGGLVGTNGSRRIGRAGSDLLANELVPPESVEGLIYACAADVEVRGEPDERHDRDSSHAGGLVGRNTGGLVYACRCTGNISGDTFIGGLVGYNATGWIRSSYATSRVHAVRYAGGVAGQNMGSILFCYAAGRVAVDGGDTQAGGISGAHSNSAYLSYWDVETTGCAYSHGGRAKTTDQMKRRETFRGWGYDGQWVLADEHDYPRLAWEGTTGEPLMDDPDPYKVGDGSVENPYQIQTIEQLLALGYGWPWFDRHFILTADINVPEIDPNTAVSVGNLTVPFSGSLDGNGHAITGFRLWSPCDNQVGIFGYIGPEGAVRNVIISASDIRGLLTVGTLAGCNAGAVSNCSVDGRVTGGNVVGGMLGANRRSGSVVACTSAGEVVGKDSAGALVDSNQGTIMASSSSVVVTATGGSAGGFVMANTGVISSCKSSSAVAGAYHAGGFVAWNGISMSGSTYWTGEIRDCYCLGAVEAQVAAGGFVGSNSAIISRCYSVGEVRSDGKAGGFVGIQEGVMGLPWQSLVEDSYWDMAASGIQTSAAATGKSSEQMRQQARFPGWDFEKVWMICEGRDYPRLRWEGVECDGTD